jgi:nuclear transcription factor Y gamma
MNFINFFLSLQLHKFVKETNSTSSTAQTVTVQSPQQSSNQQIIQLQQTQQTPTTQTGGIQIVQQIVTPSGEIQQIPVSSKNLLFNI